MSYEDLLRMLRGPYPTLMMDGCTKISPHVLAEAHDAIATLQAEVAAAREDSESAHKAMVTWRARAEAAEAEVERLTKERDEWLKEAEEQNESRCQLLAEKGELRAEVERLTRINTKYANRLCARNDQLKDPKA